MNRIRRFFAELGAFLAVAAILAGLAVGFVLPWRSAAWSTGLNHYIPARDGDAWLQTETAPDGSVTWISGNVNRVPALRALNEWRDGPRTALREFLSGGQEITEDELVARFRSAEATATRERRLAPDGKIDELITYSIRDARGEWVVGAYDVDAREDTVFEPPLLSAPADLDADAEWTSKGEVGVATYQLDVAVVEAGAHESSLGAFADCLKTESTLTLQPPEAETVVETSTSWVCAEAQGYTDAVRSTSGEDGEYTTVTVSTDDRLARELPPAPTGLAADDAAVEVTDDWDLTRIGRTSRSGDSTEATVPPVFVPGEDPLLLGASHGGDLVAFAAAPGADVRWRFHPGGTIYGTPAVDAESGRIYFGATDKRMYALDRNGFFLWSVKTGDSVATRPLLVDGAVVFASEDRRVYAVDAVTGQPRWHRDVNDAVVSSPAVAAGVIAIGSDSGAVLGLDPADGSQVWQLDAEQAVEAPIAAAGEVFVAAGNAGGVRAVAAATGEQLWAAELEAGVRAAPVAAGGSVALVDTGEGRVHLLDAATGVVTWSTAEGGYTGSVAVAGDALVAAREDGTVHELGLADGAEVRSWDAADSAGSQDRPPEFTLGVTAGGGALWLADDDSVLRRLGAAADVAQGPVSLSPAWFKTFSDAPYESTFDSPPGVAGEAAMVLDGSGNVFRVDPQTGEAEKLGTIDQDTGVFTGPVVAGDRLFAAAGGSVYARSLPDLGELWAYEAKGSAIQQPVVVGDLLVYATTPSSEEASVTATVHAVDLATGEARWTAPVDGVGAGIGVSAEDGRVFAGGVAFDAATGEQLWRHDFGPQAPVSGTASAGGVHYVAALDPKSNASSLTALSGDGTVLWTTATQDVLSVLAAPQVDEEVVVVSTLGGALAGYDRATGEHLWDFEGSSAVLGSATLYRGQVWAATTDAHVSVVDAGTGAEVAEFAELDFELEPFASVQRPTGVGDQVLVPMGALIIGFDIPGGS